MATWNVRYYIDPETGLPHVYNHDITEDEVQEAVRKGTREIAKLDRLMCRYNFHYGREWQGNEYPIKQVAPVIVENRDEIVVITVYTFYF